MQVPGNLRADTDLGCPEWLNLNIKMKRREGTLSWQKD